MSVRIDTSEWIANSLIIGNTGLGVLGSAIPSSGDSGPGFVYNDLSFPDDANKEICGRITSWPSAGTLVVYEDTSFEFSGAPEGRYTFVYQLYVDGVATGFPVEVTIIIGATTHTATGSLTALYAELSGVSVRRAKHTVSGVLVSSGASIQGVSARSGVTYHTASGVLIAATAAISATSRHRAKHNALGALSASAADVSGASSRHGLVEYVSAPSGSGYRRPMTNTTRPPQRNTYRV